MVEETSAPDYAAYADTNRLKLFLFTIAEKRAEYLWVFLCLRPCSRQLHRPAACRSRRAHPREDRWIGSGGRSVGSRGHSPVGSAPRVGDPRAQLRRHPRGHAGRVPAIATSSTSSIRLIPGLSISRRRSRRTPGLGVAFASRSAGPARRHVRTRRGQPTLRRRSDLPQAQAPRPRHSPTWPIEPRTSI